MKEFIPLNGYIEIEPIKREEIISSQSQRFEEMGKVIAAPQDPDLVDEVVFFLAHDCWETPEYEGKKHYVVKAELLLGKI